MGRAAPRDHPARDVDPRRARAASATNLRSPAAWRKNEAAVKSLRDLIFDNYGEMTINIDPDSISTGALGGATFAWRAVVEEGKEIEKREAA
jgi:hypothetical protein